ncbi:MAG: hypothetical protein AAF518_04595 [Spirochaetota bacterium]
MLNWEAPGRRTLKSYFLQALWKEGVFSAKRAATANDPNARQGYHMQIIFADDRHREMMESDAFQHDPSNFLLRELNDSLFYASFFFFPTRFVVDESITIRILYKNRLKKKYQYKIFASGYMSWLSPFFLFFSSKYKMYSPKDLQRTQIQQVVRHFLFELGRDRVFDAKL